MRQLVWVLVLALAAGLGYWLWHGMRRYREKKEAEAARMAEFLARAGALGGAKPVADSAPAANAAGDAPAAAHSGADGDPPALAQQKLLFEAATRAGEAGEPALAIQLYARLIVRYPASALAGQARARIEAQKKLVKA
jgi:TolA-binding protein